MATKKHHKKPAKKHHHKTPERKANGQFKKKR